jgi:Bacterial inner membrane protein
VDGVLLAQLVGTVGYGLLVLATFARTRTRFLVVDIAGLVPVVVHYAMLDAPAGAALSAFYMASDTVAALAARRLARLAFWLFYPLAGLIGWLFWTGPADLLAIGGTLLAITARHQRPLWRIQALIAASSIGWGLFGLMVGSAAQIGFSLVYGAAAAVNAVRFLRHPETAPGALERRR